MNDCDSNTGIAFVKTSVRPCQMSGDNPRPCLARAKVLVACQYAQSELRGQFLPNITLLVCLIKDLFSSRKHMIQAFVVNHPLGLVVAQGAHQDNLQHELRGGAFWLHFC